MLSILRDFLHNAIGAQEANANEKLRGGQIRIEGSRNEKRTRQFLTQNINKLLNNLWLNDLGLKTMLEMHFLYFLKCLSVLSENSFVNLTDH